MADNELDINQLPEDEAMVNADEALSEAIQEQLDEEYELPNDSGMLTRNIVRKIEERFEASKRNRDGDEKRWLQAYQNYRGLYAKNERFREYEKSRVFVKATKTKVIAAYGQILDVLFGKNKFPLSVRPTSVPEGAAEAVHLSSGMEPQQNMAGMAPGLPYDVGFAGDGMELPPGAKFSDLTKGLKKEFAEGGDKLKKGYGLSGEPQLKPAQQAAMRMEKLIHDQIEESNGSVELRGAVFEAALLGTGMVKGPFSFDKVTHKWETDPETGQRQYVPYVTRVPRIEFVSIWDAFPDTNARDMSEAEWFIQRHRLSRSQLRALKGRPFFDVQKINEVLDLPPDYVREDYELQIMSEDSGTYPESTRYQVLEYWGIMDKEMLEQAGVVLSDEFTHLDEVQINAWVCHGKLLRVVLNPFTPKRIPYLAFDYERTPYSFFGVGVAENMSDSQQIMNGHARMAIDNLALAGNLVLDVDENALVSGQNYELYPGKVFKRQSGMPGQAIYPIKFPSTANENMQIFDKFRQIADEATGIPSYAHGQTGVMSTTRTAAGMSMLMGAASLNVKTVVSNIDDFLLKPLGEAMFQWNMSFYEGELEVEGDLEIVAGGAASLMQNELKSQRLTAFGQLLANPAIAPFVKIPAYVRAFVESLELDPDEFINDQDQAAIYAAIIGQAGGNPLGGAPMPGGAGGMGMGQEGVPAPPMPGMEEFSGSPPTEGMG